MSKIKFRFSGILCLFLVITSLILFLLFVNAKAKNMFLESNAIVMAMRAATAEADLNFRKGQLQYYAYNSESMPNEAKELDFEVKIWAQPDGKQIQWYVRHWFLNDLQLIETKLFDVHNSRLLRLVKEDKEDYDDSFDK